MASCARCGAVKSGVISRNRAACLVPPHAVPISKRALLLGAVPLATLPSDPVLARIAVSPQLVEAFNAAFSATSFEAADAAWTRAIELDPSNSSAWSNRGTVRLQSNRWQDALSDMRTALELETRNGGKASALLLNQLGNAEGSVGDWSSACLHFEEAAQSGSELESIALANLALAYSETERDNDAVSTARRILRKDPEFLDVRCALSAFLWACGQGAEAEGEWTKLQDAQDGVGGMLYTRSTAIERVRGRWPPRPLAALDAFLHASNQGNAMGYDGVTKSYSFDKVARA